MAVVILPRWRPPYMAAILAIISGLMFAAGFCGYDQDYLAWFCFLPVLWALDSPQQTSRRAFVTGWIMGFVAHLGVYTWLIGMLRDFGYLSWCAASILYAIVCLAQSILFGVWGLGVHVTTRFCPISISWAAPLLLVLSEWSVPALFPSYLGNSQYRRIVLIQACSVWGILGLSFVIAACSGVSYATLAWATGRKRRFPAVSVSAMAILLVGMLSYGYSAVNQIDQEVRDAESPLRVGIVQANMGIYQKTEHPDEGLRRHRDQSLEVEAQGAELVVWSESGYYFALDPTVKNVKHEVMGPLHTPLLFGGMRVKYGPTGDANDRSLYNSAFLTDATGNLTASYDKTHLLAFGEYLPFGELLPWLYQLSPQSSRFMRGQDTTPLVFGPYKLGVLICYEDVLPQFVRKAMQHDPDILFNLTNDAWFGNSNEPRIHLALATFRAVEQRRFLVRSTNTGISAIIDPAGRILLETPVFARANLVGDVYPMHGTTWYQTLGDWPAYLALLVVGASMTWARWSRRLRQTK